MRKREKKTQNVIRSSVQHRISLIFTIHVSVDDVDFADKG